MSIVPLTLMGGARGGECSLRGCGPGIPLGNFVGRENTPPPISSFPEIITRPPIHQSPGGVGSNTLKGVSLKNPDPFVLEPETL
jgi:hypothetical protein